MSFTHLLFGKHMPYVVLLVLLFLGYACKKTTTPTTPTPPTSQDPPSNVDFTIKDTVYNFVTNSNDTTTTIKLTATANNATSYTWNFGDGLPEETTTTPSVEHKYKTTKDYTVVVTAHNGSKDAPPLSKSIGKVNVFNGGLELVYIDNSGGLEAPSVLDTLKTKTFPSEMLLSVELDGGASIFTKFASPNSHILHPDGSGLYQSVFLFNKDLTTTVKMSPYNKQFRFRLVKIVSIGANYGVADYREITAKRLWDMVLNTDQQKKLLKGEIISGMRIFQYSTQVNDYTRLFFNARLIAI